VHPKPFVVGFIAQYLLFPAVCFLLVRLTGAPPSLALGVLLVAACPAGNMSNFLTHLGRGTTSLSISMTALSTLAAPVMMPLVFGFWASRVPGASGLRHGDLRLDPIGLIGTMLVILGIPLVLGLTVSMRWSALAARAARPFRIFSLVVFLVFIALALVANGRQFLLSVPKIGTLVALQNAVALSGGYLLARLSGLAEGDRRAIGFEIGIRNAGLGLALVLAFFGGIGGMAVATGWYGVWDLIVGFGLATWWARRPPLPVPA
jgi:BASS family bile acid:Na+ symporter